MTRLGSVVGVWNRFWFEPQSTSVVAVIRILFGLAILAWAISLAFDLRAFYADSGILPEGVSFDYRHGVFEISDDMTVVVVVYALLLAGAVGLTLGWRTRLAAVVVFVALLSFQRRMPYVNNSGDVLLRIIALYLVLAPCGEALSLDRLRTARDRFWEFPLRAPWAMRLLQLQLVVVYLVTFWRKGRGETWEDGSAVGYALGIEDLRRFVFPAAIRESLVWSNVMTLSTFWLEVSVPFLIWNRRLRPYVIGAGIAFHLFIDLAMTVGFFSLGMYCLYTAFVPAETMDRVLLRLRRAPPPVLGAFPPVRDEETRREPEEVSAEGPVVPPR